MLKKPGSCSPHGNLGWKHTEKYISRKVSFFFGGGCSCLIASWKKWTVIMELQRFITEEAASSTKWLPSVFLKFTGVLSCLFNLGKVLDVGETTPNVFLLCNTGHEQTWIIQGQAVIGRRYEQHQIKLKVFQYISNRHMYMDTDPMPLLLTAKGIRF